MEPRIDHNHFDSILEEGLNFLMNSIIQRSGDQENYGAHSSHNGGPNDNDMNEEYSSNSGDPFELFETMFGHEFCRFI